MKRLLVPILFLFILDVNAQDSQDAKPDCKPKSCSIKEKKSCGPTNTKLGEAKVIFELRNDMQELKDELGLFGKIVAGMSDEESLTILVSEMKQITQAKGEEFPELRDSKAGKVADLRKILKKVSRK